MPNIKSAAKRVKTAAKAHARNVAAKSKLKTLKKAFVAAADAEKGPEAYAAYCSALDKAAKHGIIPKNTAVRKKGRAAARLRKAAAPAAE
jgi:small subunit ribosomal protein S20